MDQLLSTAIKYIVGIFGVGIIVLLHEIGHFVAARIFKIDVEIFSIGFGPKMIGKKLRRTEYRISYFLFGGYCKMKGADDLTRALDHNKKKFIHVESGSLFSVKPLAKFLTYLAGPITNFLLTIFLCTALFFSSHQTLSTPAVVTPVNEYPTLFNNSSSPAASNGIQKNDRILKLNNIEILDWQEFTNLLSEHNFSNIDLLIERDNRIYNIMIEGELSENNTYRYGLTNVIKPVISLVRLFSPEYKAGLKKADQIIEVNDIKIENNLDLLKAFNQIDSNIIDLKVLRDNNVVNITYTPKYNKDGSINHSFSLYSPTKTIEGEPLSFALSNGISMSIRLFKDTLDSIFSLFKKKTDDIRTVFTGPMRASLMIGNITVLGFENSIKSGLRAFLYLLAIVSISLTIANLLPIPAFDGGQMLIALIEMITNKKISPKHYWATQIFGLVCVVILFSIMYFIDFRYFFRQL